MKKIIIISILLLTLLLASCSQQGDSKNEKVNNNISNNQTKVITQVNAKELKNIDSNTRVITIDAKRWEYSIKEIKVKKGEKIIIKINNIDTTHGIVVPEMKLVGDEEIILDTSKTGIFEFRCANYCGSGHSTMEGKIIIE